MQKLHTLEDFCDKLSSENIALKQLNSDTRRAEAGNVIVPKSNSKKRKRKNKNAQSDSQGYGNSPTDTVFQGQGRETVSAAPAAAATQGQSRYSDDAQGHRIATPQQQRHFSLNVRAEGEHIIYVSRPRVFPTHLFSVIIIQEKHYDRFANVIQL